MFGPLAVPRIRHSGMRVCPTDNLREVIGGDGSWLVAGIRGCIRRLVGLVVHVHHCQLAARCHVVCGVRCHATGDQ